MKLFKQLAVIVAGSIAFASCQKHDDTPAQPNKLTIDINTLQDGQSFKTGDTLKMQGLISYITQLHGYEMTLKSKSTGKELFYYYEHSHSDKVSINQSWVDTLSHADTLQFILTAEIDHDGNQSSKQLTFTSQP